MKAEKTGSCARLGCLVGVDRARNTFFLFFFYISFFSPFLSHFRLSKVGYFGLFRLFFKHHFSLFCFGVMHPISIVSPLKVYLVLKLTKSRGSQYHPLPYRQCKDLTWLQL